MAAREGNIETVRLLLDDGRCDVNIQNYVSQYVVVCLVFVASMDISSLKQREMTAFTSAVRSGREEVVRLFLEYGLADMNRLGTVRLTQ